MKKIFCLFAFLIFLGQAAEAQPVQSRVGNEMRQDNDRSVFILVEYAPDTNHLSDDDAPTGGYNEDNQIWMIKVGKEFDWKPGWKYALSAGFTTYDNSYDEDSNGLGVGAEAIYIVNRNVNLYGGGDFGFVSGYDGHVDDDFVIFDEYIPFLALNAGVEFEINDYLPTLRGGVKYVPASIVDSDDVVALTIGTRIKF